MGLPQLMLAERVPFHARKDPVGEAADRLLALLPAREDSRVLADFLEDDLREGLDVGSGVEAHFPGMRDALRSEGIRPVRLLEAGEGFRVLRRVEYLFNIVAQLRRRLARAAGRVRCQEDE